MSRFLWPGLLVGCYFLLFYRLADRDLWSSHEARAAMDAASVLDGSPLPRLFDGRAEVQKPPLYYWLVALLARVRGGEVDALAVRLPAAFSALLLVLLLGWLVGRQRPQAGWLTACVLLTGIHLTWLARIGRIDVPLALTVSVSALCFHLALRRPEKEGEAVLPPSPPFRGRGPRGASRDEPCSLGEGVRTVGKVPPCSRAFAPLSPSPSPPQGGEGGKNPPPCQVLLLLAGYTAAALGVLFKGPIGLVLPAAITATSLLLEGRWPAIWELRAWGRLLRELRVGWGLALVLAVTLPVFVWADRASGGEFAGEFFWHHNVERGLGGPHLRSHAWWLYGPYFFVYFLPWSPLVLLAFFRGAWRLDPLARFGLAWTVAVLGVLSCAHFKRPDYLTPAYPGAALFLGCVLERWRMGQRRWVLPGVLVLAGVSFLGQMARLEWELPAEEPFRDYKTFAAAIRERVPAPGEVVFFRTEAHALAFRVGRPQAVVVEWQELQAKLCAGATHVVAPPEWVEEMSHSLSGLGLEEVCRNTDFSAGGVERVSFWRSLAALLGRNTDFSDHGHERPLVLLRVESHALIAAPAPHRRRPDQRHPAGP